MAAVKGFYSLEPGSDGLVVLAEAGRREVGLAGAGVRVVVEAERRAGELDAAEGRVVDVDQQALGQRLLPLVHLLEVADLAGRDPLVRKAFQPHVRRLGGERGLDRGGQLVAMRDPLRS